MGRIVFYIHGHIVHQALIDDGFQHVGAVAVGIQLDLVAQRADLTQQLRQIGVERRLTAGDAVRKFS